MTIRIHICLALLAAALVAAACRSPAPALPVSPGVTFAAHRSGDSFVVDRSRSGETGAIEARGRLHDPDAPGFVVRVGGEARAGLWVVGRSRVVVRNETSVRAPRTGDVLASWDGDAIRLALYPATGAPLETGTFVSADAPGRSLVRTADPAGTYRATVRESGADVGWLRIDVGSENAPRAYDAVLPDRVDDGLAAAAVVALDAELRWIAEHRAGAEER